MRPTTTSNTALEKATANFFTTTETLSSLKLKSEKQKKLKNLKAFYQAPCQVLCLTNINGDIIMGLSNGQVIIKSLNPNTVTEESGEGKEVVIKAHSGPVCCVCKYSDGFITGAWDKKLKLWKNNSLVKVFEGHSDFVKCVTTAGDLIISGSSDKNIMLWSLKDGSSFILKGHSRAVEDVKFDKWVFSCSSDRTIRIWSLESQECLSVIQAHETSVYGLYIYILEEELISCSADCFIKRWSIKDEENPVVEEQNSVKQEKWVRKVICTEQYVISGGSDQIVHVYNKQLEHIGEFDGHVDDVSDIEVVDGGQRIISCSYDGSVRLWDLKDLSKSKKVEAVKNEKEENGVGKENLLSAEEEAELEELM